MTTVIHDITTPLNQRVPIYPGDPDLQIQDWRTLANGDAANVSMLHFGAHTGTHVDAPAHFIEGAPRVDALSLDILIGEAIVIDVPNEHKSIDESLVREYCGVGTIRVLFRTRNSALWKTYGRSFQQDYTYLELTAAQLLAERGVRLVGIDYLSIEEFGNSGHETHLALLSKGVIILEGLNLIDVPAGKYELICLPLRLSDGKGDGAPARVVLRTLQH